MSDEGRCSSCNCLVFEEPHTETCDVLYSWWITEVEEAKKRLEDAMDIVKRLQNSREIVGKKDG